MENLPPPGRCAASLPPTLLRITPHYGALGVVAGDAVRQPAPALRRGERPRGAWGYARAGVCLAACRCPLARATASRSQGGVTSEEVACGAVLSGCFSSSSSSSKHFGRKGTAKHSGSPEQPTRRRSARHTSSTRSTLGGKRRSPPRCGSIGPLSDKAMILTLHALIGFQGRGI